MYFNIHFNVFFKLKKVHLLVSELYEFGEFKLDQAGIYLNLIYSLYGSVVQQQQDLLPSVVNFGLKLVRISATQQNMNTKFHKPLLHPH